MYQSPESVTVSCHHTSLFNPSKPRIHLALRWSSLRGQGRVTGACSPPRKYPAPPTMPANSAKRTRQRERPRCLPKLYGTGELGVLPRGHWGLALRVVEGGGSPCYVVDRWAELTDASRQAVVFRYPGTPRLAQPPLAPCDAPPRWPVACLPSSVRARGSADSADTLHSYACKLLLSPA